MTLEHARKFALSLPETSEQPHFEATSFRVCGKIFATVPAGATHLHIFVDEDQRAPLIAAAPAVFEALLWGAKCVGVRVLLAKADGASVKRLLLEGWTRKAPKRLAAQRTA
ncbi:MAG: MmcQ/YjbR family DNA-binding protein [Pseudomonadota bacterium]